MKNTIIISAATYFILNSIVWMLGWFIWPFVFLGLWIGAGHLSWLMEKSFASWRNYEDILKRDRYMHYLFSPIYIIVNFFEYKDELLSKLKLPSIRNPFVWPEKNDD